MMMMILEGATAGGTMRCLCCPFSIAVVLWGELLSADETCTRKERAHTESGLALVVVLDVEVGVLLAAVFAVAVHG